MPDEVLNDVLDSASDDQSANSTGRTPLVIDSNLRTIQIPTDYVFGVQNDKDVLTVPFVSPRYCDGVDLSELSIRVNFTTKSGLSSYYDVTDKTVNTDTIEFTWLLGAAVFVSVGDLTFAVCLRKVEADGRITREFNTTLATAKILPGLTVEDQKDLSQYSILVQMQNLADSVSSTIETAEEYADQLRNYVGAPLVATVSSDMTDQNRIYVYVGNESGYNNGHWYYYQSLTWHDGGTYSALPAGDYPDIYAGNVMSDRNQTDQTPYLFRKTASELGSSRFGQRCYPVLVGASVGENQLIEWGGEYVSNATDARENIMLFIRYGTGLADPNAFSKTISSVGLVSAIINATRSATGINIYHNGQFTNIYFYTDTDFEWMIGHKYIFSADFLGVNPTVVGGIKINNMMIIDLTQMFGSTIADYAYTLEQATAGSGIAWLRSYGFLGGYVPHNAGSIESVEVTEKKVVGFNQWDEEWEAGYINNSTGENVSSNNYIRSKNYIPITGSTLYVKTPFALKLIGYDANKMYVRDISYIWMNETVDANYLKGVSYLRFYSAASGQTTYNHDICINLSNPDRNGEYEPYTTISYPLGTDTLRGIFKLDANNQLYADGDRKEADGTVTRRYGIVDLGTLNWAYHSATHQFRAALPQLPKDYKPSETPNAICTKYIAHTHAALSNGQMSIFYASVNGVNIIDSAYTDADTFKAAMSGVMLVYELATPTTETSTPFTSPQIVYPDGTEEFVTENGVPVGHVTKYPYDLKTQAERLIDIPDVPSTNGTYVLKATRSSSGINYTWVTG